MKLPVLSTRQIFQLLKDPKTRILDLRSSDAYNGWRLDNEKRGGHIPGAVSLDVKWTRYIDWIEIVYDKGISKDEHLILYSGQFEDCEKVGAMLYRAGFQNISAYRNFVDEWTEDTRWPMEKLKRYSKLVPPRWLWSVVLGEDVEESPAENFVLLHCHYRNRQSYLSGHIPGAVDMDTLALESPETWNRRSPGELKTALESHGIDANTTVVVYGKFLWPDNEDEFPGSAAGHIGAIRVAFILMYAGVKDVRILNGGFQSWMDEAFPVGTMDVPKKKMTDFGVKIPANPELAVDLDEARKMIEAPDAEIVCVRSWPEYTGQVSGYNYIEKKGRIPGAVFGNCGSDAYHMENYRNPDHTVKAENEVRSQWEKLGITPDKHLAFYCGTGWRGSEAFLNAWLMGWPKVSVFDGGWFEWSKDSENPFETGIPLP